MRTFPKWLPSLLLSIIISSYKSAPEEQGAHHSVPEPGRLVPDLGVTVPHFDVPVQEFVVLGLQPVQAPVRIQNRAKRGGRLRLRRSSAVDIVVGRPKEAAGRRLRGHHHQLPFLLRLVGQHREHRLEVPLVLGPHRNAGHAAEVGARGQAQFAQALQHDGHVTLRERDDVGGLLLHSGRVRVRRRRRNRRGRNHRVLNRFSNVFCRSVSGLQYLRWLKMFF